MSGLIKKLKYIACYVCLHMIYEIPQFQVQLLAIEDKVGYTGNGDTRGSYVRL